MKKLLISLVFLLFSTLAHAGLSGTIYEIESLGEKWRNFTPCQRLFILGYAAYSDCSLKRAEKYFSECDGEYPVLQNYITLFLKKIKEGGDTFDYVDRSKENAKEIKYLESEPKTPENRFKLARAYFKNRQYDKSAELFKGSSQYREYRLASLEYLATSLARQEKYDEAIEIHRQIIDKYPTSREAKAKAMFKIGFLYLDSGNYDSAKDEFLRLQKFAPSYQKEQVKWYLAWCAYKNGGLDEASYRFKSLEKNGGKNWKARAQFWRARALEDMGKNNAAEGIYRGLAESGTIGYYGIISARKLNESLKVIARSLPETDDEAISCNENNSGDCFAPTSVGSHAKKPAGERNDNDFETVIELDLLGLNDLVGVELDRIIASKSKKLDWMKIYQLAKKNDAWNIVNRLTRGHFSHQDEMKSERWVFEGSYPKAYSKIVNDFAARVLVEPLFVWSIMREESTFKPHAISKSGAIGLMQLMPFTARRMMKSPYFEIKDLLIPRYNIEAGINYLGFLIKHYNKNLFLVSAAYNAGEEAVDRWLGGKGDLDSVEFVEEIPYKETLDYVRKVMKTYWMYNEIYSQSR